MSISTIGYWILESLEGIKKNSKTFLIGLGTMYVVLSLIGGLYILYLNANAFMGDLKEDESKVNLYVEGLNDEDVTEILSILYNIDGISDVEYVNTDEAYEKAKEMSPNLVKDISPEDGVFKASFVITLDGRKNGNTSEIKNEIYSIDKLYSAITNDSGFKRAEKSIKVAMSVRIITITVLILVTIMGCFVMMNSIKLALYARRKEISIMKYVGATDRYARAPFIIEGLIIAILAAGITLLLTNVVYGSIVNASANVQLFDFLVPKAEVLSSLTTLLLLVSIGIGTVGSSMSINKYLDV